MKSGVLMVSGIIAFVFILVLLSAIVAYIKAIWYGGDTFVLIIVMNLLVLLFSALPILLIHSVNMVGKSHSLASLIKKVFDLY